MGTKRIKRIVGVATIALAVAGASTTYAKPGFLTAAKRLGFPAQDCAYCHTKASGGSGWNARGQWLRTQKRERRASAVNVEWLREYKGN